MKRTPLKRGTTRLKRSRLKARRGKARRSERERDEAYLNRVRDLPCCAASLGPYCLGVIDPDHMGQRPMGRKCSDYETAPLCRAHHRARTDFFGPFTNWTYDQMRSWLDGKIAETQAALGYRTEAA